MSLAITSSAAHFAGVGQQPLPAQEAAPLPRAEGPGAPLRLVQQTLQQAARQALLFAQRAELARQSPEALAEGELGHRHAVAGLALEDVARRLQAGGLPAILTSPQSEQEEGQVMRDPSDMDTCGLVWNAHSDFYKQIAELLGLLQVEWLSKYQDALATFLEFYKEFTAAMEQISQGASGDKGNVWVNFDAAKKALSALTEKYGLAADGAGDNPLASFKTMKEAEAFIASMGLPGLKAQEQADGSVGVYMDLDSVNALIVSMNNGTWDSARYNAWVSNKDSHLEQIKHSSKVLGEKLGEMTQKFDNIVKILSSTIDKITEADMSFIRTL